MAKGDVKTVGQILKELQPGSRYVKLAKIQPTGSLEAKKLAGGAIIFNWRYTFKGKDDRPIIGTYDPHAPPKSLEPTERGFSYMAAVRAAEAMALEHYKSRGDGGRPALVAQKEKEISDAQKMQEIFEKKTLKQLCNDYCDFLSELGRSSHRDSRSIFQLHVVEAFPKIANLPAKEVSATHVASMMRKLYESNKGRTSNKLRSYLRAAYTIAQASVSKPNIPEKFQEYGIVHNPAAETFPDESANKPGKRPLSENELIEYCKIIQADSSIKGATLRLHLFTGGQRIKQFVELKTEDVTSDSITIYDGKGRPGRPPRPHLIPLIKEGMAALAECKPAGMYAISTDGGETHIHETTLSDWAKTLVGEKIPNFQLKRVRSGIETLLASKGIDKSIRGRLQSHGISGVQDRHYDGYEYLKEKMMALVTLHAALNPKIEKSKGENIEPPI